MRRWSSRMMRRRWNINAVLRRRNWRNEVSSHPLVGEGEGGGGEASTLLERRD